ncbi:hypothetical protein BJV77DRAFT_962339 [Russula vinacea]|nr:hypothetical protein BJV77DRAFT_962339 [Russula vinacea]
MSSGLPVLACNSGGPTESIVDDPPTARLGGCATRSIGWADVLDEIAGLAPSERSALADRARARAREHFGMEAMALKLEGRSWRLRRWDGARAGCTLVWICRLREERSSVGPSDAIRKRTLNVQSNGRSMTRRASSPPILRRSEAVLGCTVLGILRSGRRAEVPRRGLRTGPGTRQTPEQTGELSIETTVFITTGESDSALLLPTMSGVIVILRKTILSRAVVFRLTVYPIVYELLDTKSQCSGYAAAQPKIRNGPCGDYIYRT